MEMSVSERLPCSADLWWPREEKTGSHSAQEHTGSMLSVSSPANFFLILSHFPFKIASKSGPVPH